jgi:hypothetical protein
MGRSTESTEQQGITAMIKVGASTAHTVTSPSSRPDGGSASLTGRPTMAPTGPRWNTDWRLSYAAGTAPEPGWGLAAPAALNLAPLPLLACAYTRKEDDRGNLTGPP